MDNNFNMTFEESQDYISRRGFDIPWNDCDVFVDEREINRTVGNVLKWADKTMIDKACEWVENHIFDFPWYDNEHGDFSSKDVANALRKAMEE